MRKVKVGIYQYRLNGRIPDSIIKSIIKNKLDFFVLPEYFFSRFDVSKISDNAFYYDEFIKYIKKLSKVIRDTVIIGTLIKEENRKFYNIGFAVVNSKNIGCHKKINLFGREIGDIEPGDTLSVFKYKGINFAILICADVLHDDNFKVLSELRPDIVFIPTFSPYKKESLEDKIKRDKNIFLKRAIETGSIIVKVCGINTPLLPYPIQGRSLVCSLRGIIYRVPYYLESSTVFKIFSLKVGDRINSS